MDRSFRSVFVSLVVLGWMSPQALAHTDISVQQAMALISANDQLVVVDVREEQAEYCDAAPLPPLPPGHIPGALNYPWTSGVFQDRYSELPPDTDILLVCRSGNRSNQAAEFLDAEGYTSVYDMAGGMLAWTGATVVCIDTDRDGVNDDLDNCPDVYNPGQEDSNSNGVGDACEVARVPALSEWATVAIVLLLLWVGVLAMPRRSSV